MLTNMTISKKVVFLIAVLLSLTCCSPFRKNMNLIDGDKQKQGIWIVCNSDSTSIVRYEDDKLSGRYLVYDQGGLLLVKGRYKRGQRVGSWKFYHKGVVASKVYYINGKSHIRYVKNADWY